MRYETNNYYSSVKALANEYSMASSRPNHNWLPVNVRLLSTCDAYWTLQGPVATDRQQRQYTLRFLTGQRKVT